jgi:HAMP domain-containing protein
MSDSPDPSEHKAAQERFIDHIKRLMDDPRFMIDTTAGRRAVKGFLTDLRESDQSAEVHRLMSEMKRPDRQLLESMPVGKALELTLSRKRWLVLKQAMGHLRVICVSPSRQLLEDAPLKPMTAQEVNKLVRQLPPPLNGVPITTILVSTSGFAMEALELAERTAERTLILAEPNDARGWSIHGPPETKALNDLLDPEDEDEKRQRVRDLIAENEIELVGGGIVAEKVATKAKLPLQQVEAELKSYAKQTPGLIAKRLDGRVVLYREGTTPIAPLTGKSAARNPSGDTDMPILDRIRSLFSHKGETEKKIAFLSERRTVLSLQRDRGYEEIGALEQKDNELREQFKAARAPLTKRRITTQLVQLRKDIERRQQMLAVLNQQVNVVSTHLHNLELTQQGQLADLPDSEEIATDAAAAEEMLAKLQADNELAESVGAGVGGSIATAGMSDEEQALYAELEAEHAPAAAPAAPSAASSTPQSNAPEGRAETRVAAAPTPATPASSKPARAQPEPG